MSKLTMKRVEKQLVMAASIVLVYLIFGTWFFSWQEGWRVFDAFYFSAITLTTVGYGDFLPTTDASKLIAVFYAFSGISIIFYSLSIFAREYFEHQENRFDTIRDMPGKIIRRGAHIPVRIIRHHRERRMVRRTKRLLASMRQVR